MNLATNKINRRFVVAPMLDLTHRHCRYFHRILTKQALLFSEMISDQAIIHGNRERLLGFDQAELPLVLQIGGSAPEELFKAVTIANDYNYSEINLNAGCPSPRVKCGNFGAALMLEPELLYECLLAIKEASDQKKDLARDSIPVSLKCRLGVDHQEPLEVAPRIIELAIKAGCSAIYLHARKAWLDGLSPKDNRTIPPLDYELAKKLKPASTSGKPPIDFIINGGINSLEDASELLNHFDGVMLGRAAYYNPLLLAKVDRLLYGKVEECQQAPKINPDPRFNPVLNTALDTAHNTALDTALDTALGTIYCVLNEYLPYCLAEENNHNANEHNRQNPQVISPNVLTNHLLGLFDGLFKARKYRQALSGNHNLASRRITEVLRLIDEASEHITKLNEAEPCPAPDRLIREDLA